MLQRHDDVDSLLNDLVQKVKDLVDGRTERNVVESVRLNKEITNLANTLNMGRKEEK